MGLRGWLKRLERGAEEELVVILQQDGTTKRFPESDLKEAYVRNCDALRARANGEELPEPHPVQLAIRNAAQHESWHDIFVDLIFEDLGEVEDLSEP